MPRLWHLRTACACGALALWSIGCDNSATTPGPSTTKTSDHGHDEHGHGEHGHDEHGHGDEHGHPDEGPHHGVLVMFEGHAAHFELVFDSKTGTLTAYPLDGAAKKEVPVEGDELELSVVAREGGEPAIFTLKRAEGKEAKFTGQSDALKGKEKWDGAFVKTKIDGQEYAETKFKYPEGNHEH